MSHNLSLVLQAKARKNRYLRQNAFERGRHFLGLQALDLCVDRQLAHLNLSQLGLGRLRGPPRRDQLTQRLDRLAKIPWEAQLLKLVGDFDILSYRVAAPVGEAPETGKLFNELGNLLVFRPILAALQAQVKLFDLSQV